MRVQNIYVILTTNIGSKRRGLSISPMFALSSCCARLDILKRSIKLIISCFEHLRKPNTMDLIFGASLISLKKCVFVAKFDETLIIKNSKIMGPSPTSSIKNRSNDQGNRLIMPL